MSLIMHLLAGYRLAEDPHRHANDRAVNLALYVTCQPDVRIVSRRIRRQNAVTTLRVRRPTCLRVFEWLKAFDMVRLALGFDGLVRDATRMVEGAALK